MARGGSSITGEVKVRARTSLDTVVEWWCSSEGSVNLCVHWKGFVCFSLRSNVVVGSATFIRSSDPRAY